MEHLAFGQSADLFTIAFCIAPQGEGKGKISLCEDGQPYAWSSKAGLMPGSENNQTAPTRARPFHAHCAQGSSISPPAQGSSTSPPVPQEAPGVPEIAAAPAACGPARELSGRFGTNADFI